MSVELVRITPDAERLILYIARVSSNQENADPGLLRFLIRQKHWSPFEMAHMVLEFNTSRAIGRQMIRHGKGFSFQEFSQRYASPDGYVSSNARRQADSNRQSSVDDLPQVTRAWWLAAQAKTYLQSAALYQESLDRGIARECARLLLPEFTRTKIYMAGSVRSWIHYIQQRIEQDTQLEHRELAVGAQRIFCKELPVIADALKWPCAE